MNKKEKLKQIRKQRIKAFEEYSKKLGDLHDLEMELLE